MKELYADGNKDEVCVERSVRLETSKSFMLTGRKTIGYSVNVDLNRFLSPLSPDACVCFYRRCVS